MCLRVGSTKATSKLKPNPRMSSSSSKNALEQGIRGACVHGFGRAWFFQYTESRMIRVFHEKGSFGVDSCIQLGEVHYFMQMAHLLASGRAPE